MLGYLFFFDLTSAGHRTVNCISYRKSVKFRLSTRRWLKIRPNRIAATTTTVIIATSRFDQSIRDDRGEIQIECRCFLWSFSKESVCSTSSQTSSEMSESSATADRSSRHQQPSGISYHGLDFQLIVENKSGNGPGKVVHLVAPSMQDKAAWISDISQVIEFVLVSFLFLFYFVCLISSRPIDFGPTHSNDWRLFCLVVYRQRPFQRFRAQFHIGCFVGHPSAFRAQRSASLQRRHRHPIQPHPQLVQSQSRRPVNKPKKQTNKQTNNRLIKNQKKSWNIRFHSINDESLEETDRQTDRKLSSNCWSPLNGCDVPFIGLHCH